MQKTFEITPDRNFLQHFLTGWRVKSLSPEMVDHLKAKSQDNPYAAWLWPMAVAGKPRRKMSQRGQSPSHLGGQ